MNQPISESLDCLQQKLRNQEVRSEDLVKQSLLQIEQQSHTWQTSISLLKEDAIARAQKVDAAFEKGDKLPP